MPTGSVCLNYVVYSSSVPDSSSSSSSPSSSSSSSSPLSSSWSSSSSSSWSSPSCAWLLCGHFEWIGEREKKITHIHMYIHLTLRFTSNNMARYARETTAAVVTDSIEKKSGPQHEARKQQQAGNSRVYISAPTTHTKNTRENSRGHAGSSVQ